ncbi:hypothetical protein ACF07W_06530 [Streptomyces sp. NPDC015140]|uniref:hypothetical protein n=1 Tax=Streptomyces sp. NPDC015140 TaxID=3364943 RepID=UPI0037025007
MTQPLNPAQSLERLDGRFKAATIPDPERSLSPWVRPAIESSQEMLGKWWAR